MAGKKKKRPGSEFVRPSGGGPAQVNQHAPIFNDRRTNRERDRSSQNRSAIRRSFDGE